MSQATVIRSVVFALALALCPHALARPSVVVYTSLDQPFSEPVLRRFEKQTGIRVKALYDLEANKTVGLANRLLAEMKRPRADVYWNNEPMHTVMLARRGVFETFETTRAAGIPDAYRDPASRWYGFGGRARVLLVDSSRVTEAEMPKAVSELAHPRWKGKAAMAKPLFGTTATHVAALFAVQGAAKGRTFLEALRANGIRLADGNSGVRDQVVRGEALVGLTDTDDALSAVRAGKPVRMIFPDQGSGGALLLPNTVSIVKGAPHPAEARRLAEYLLGPEVEEALARGPSQQIPLRPGLAGPEGMGDVRTLETMRVRFEAVEAAMPEATRAVQEILLND